MFRLIIGTAVVVIAFLLLPFGSISSISVLSFFAAFPPSFSLSLSLSLCPPLSNRVTTPFSLVHRAPIDFSPFVPRDFAVKRARRERGWRLAILTDREEASDSAGASCRASRCRRVRRDRAEVGTKNEDGIKGGDEMNP